MLCVSKFNFNLAVLLVKMKELNKFIIELENQLYNNFCKDIMELYCAMVKLLRVSQNYNIIKGKTFTMLGTPNNPGILPCALRDIFMQI